MAKKRSTVLIGMLGPSLDMGAQDNRWNRWRPSVAACLHPDLEISRFELLHPQRYSSLAHVIERDVVQISPETEVRCAPLDFQDPWDFEEVYGTLHDYARKYPFDPDREDYLVHITTGTHVVQICMFLLTESRHFPGKLLQTSPPPPRADGRTSRSRDERTAGTWRAIDLDLSRYDRLATRFAAEAIARTGVLKAGIETRNPTFNALIARIERVSLSSRAPMLLTGPTVQARHSLHVEFTK
jgi:transcriptional regulatory protein RtcR